MHFQTKEYLTADSTTITAIARFGEEATPTFWSNWNLELSVGYGDTVKFTDRQACLDSFN